MPRAREILDQVQSYTTHKKGGGGFQGGRGLPSPPGLAFSPGTEERSGVPGGRKAQRGARGDVPPGGRDAAASSDVKHREHPGSHRALREDAAHCKARPTQNKGSGGSRDFVPWCDRKR